MTKKEEYIRNAMKNLDITRAEAEEMWNDDHDIDAGKPKDFDLTAEQEKAVQEMTKTSGVRKLPSETKERKKTERKPNEDKRMLIQLLADALAEYTPNIEKIEREVTFTYAGTDYSVTLTAHRAKKG